MPQIGIRGMEISKVRSISKTLADNLVQIVGCPKDYFTIEHISTTYFMDGEEILSYPFVEVAWFDRGQVIQDKTAGILSKTIRDQGYDLVQIVFIPYDESRY